MSHLTAAKPLLRHPSSVSSSSNPVVSKSYFFQTRSPDRSVQHQLKVTSDESSEEESQVKGIEKDSEEEEKEIDGIEGDEEKEENVDEDKKKEDETKQKEEVEGNEREEESDNEEEDKEEEEKIKSTESRQQQSLKEINKETTEPNIEPETATTKSEFTESQPRDETTNLPTQNEQNKKDEPTNNAEPTVFSELAKQQDAPQLEKKEKTLERKESAPRSRQHLSAHEKEIEQQLWAKSSPVTIKVSPPSRKVSLTPAGTFQLDSLPNVPFFHFFSKNN